MKFAHNNKTTIFTCSFIDKKINDLQQHGSDDKIEATRSRAKSEQKVFHREEEDGRDIFKQEKTEAIKMKKRISRKLIRTDCSKLTARPECLKVKSRTPGKNIKVNMLTTMVLLATIATCYGLGVVVVASNSAQVCCSRSSSSAKTEELVLAEGNSSNSGRLRRSPARSVGGNSSSSSSATATRAPTNNNTGNRQQQQQPTTTGNSAEQFEASGTTLSRPPTTIKNVTAQNGQPVLLHCLVEPSSDVVVSWFRGTGELQLLTYESNTVIQDERFVVRHAPMSKIGAGNDDDWALQIKNLDKNTDSGLYQCQTNTDPPQGQYYQLNIVEPQVNILGAPDMAVKLGAAINLTCVISQSPDQLQFIFWYRDDRMINYDINERGKIVMSKWAQKPDTITSNLQIFSSKLSDSGNYTCMPSGARPMSIYVHVLEGLDKRLIMFQNDYDPSAASSQQTNSAISVHVVRLSRGRAYALFVAFIIFTSWFQLVAQIQTAISLLLLAIIGFFLGKVTDTPTQLPAYLTEEYNTAKAFKADEKFATLDTSNVASNKRRRQNKKDFLSSPMFAIHNSDNGESPTGNDDDETESPEHSQVSSTAMDPLIKRANSALNLLKTLGSSGSCSGDDGTASIGSPASERCLSAAVAETPLRPPTTITGEKKATERQQKQEKPLTSPSASSSSSSSASTGYNSDTRSTNLTGASPVVVVVVGANKSKQDTLMVSARRRNLTEEDERHENNLQDSSNNNDVDEDEMIELVRQPTALRLIMDEFSGELEAGAAGERRQRFGHETTRLASKPIAGQQVSSNNSAPPPPVNSTPLKPPRLEQIMKPVDQFVSVDLDEPHYSSPSPVYTTSTTTTIDRRRQIEEVHHHPYISSSSIPPSPSALSERYTSATCDRRP